MNTLLWLLGGELALVLSACTIWGWRRRTARERQLAALVKALETDVPERRGHYCRWLREHGRVEEEQALCAANRWLAEERAFWRHWLAWQLQPDPSTLEGLPASLHRCIDVPLESLANGPAGGAADSKAVAVEAGAEDIVVTPAESGESGETASGGNDADLAEDEEGPMILSDRDPRATKTATEAEKADENSRPDDSSGAGFSPQQSEEPAPQ